MNQILAVENKKKKKSSLKSTEIAGVIIFFAVILIIFGLTLITQASYAIYKESKGRNVENLPIVSVTRMNDKINIVVNSVKQIENLIYSWNDSEETIISANEDTYIQEQILLPIGNSILNIGVEETDGRIVRYKKEIIVEGLDLREPTIDIEKEGTTGQIKITATDETQMSYITYSLDGADEVRIDRSEIENKSINYILKLEKGEHKLVVTAVDTSGNVGSQEKTIIVSPKSDIQINNENGKVVITVMDQDGIKNIEINLNGLVYTVDAKNQKGVRIPPLDMVSGKNTIRVKVTNVNSLETVETKEIDYVQ